MVKITWKPEVGVIMVLFCVKQYIHHYKHFQTKLKGFEMLKMLLKKMFIWFCFMAYQPLLVI